MRKVSLASGVALTLISLATAAQRLSFPQPAPSFPVVPATIGGSNLPFQPIGASDLIHLTVYDSPELSQTFRVDKEGNLNLPLLHHPLPAVGLMPDVLRDDIAAALKAQHLLVNPVVDVSVVDDQMRPVVDGALGELLIAGVECDAGSATPVDLFAAGSATAIANQVGGI